MQKFQVPQIPAAVTRNLVKNLQTQLSKAAAALPKQFELQKQFYPNIRLEPITLKVLVPFQKTDNPVPKAKPSVKVPKHRQKEHNTRIDLKIALSAYNELRKGTTKKKIAEELKFNESQFRKNKLLIEAKRLAKVERDEKKAAYRLMSVSGAMGNNGGKKYGCIPKGDLGYGKRYFDYDNDNSEDNFD